MVIVHSQQEGSANVIVIGEPAKSTAQVCSLSQHGCSSHESSCSSSSRFSALKISGCIASPEVCGPVCQWGGGTSYRGSATLGYLATPAHLSPHVGKQNQRSLETSYGHTVRKDKAQTRTQGRLGQGLRGSFTHPLSFSYCLNQSHTHSLMNSFT